MSKGPRRERNVYTKTYAKDRTDKCHYERGMGDQIMQAMNALREKNLLCDAIIELDDGSELPVHRNILSVCSDYFRALFIDCFSDILIKYPTRIHGINRSTMNCILDFAYLRKLEVTPNNVAKVFLAANYFCIDKAEDICCQYFKSLLTPSNCIGLILFARDHFCKKLEMDVLKYILTDFESISMESKEILYLSGEYLEQILAFDELNVKSEGNLWNFILRWVDHDKLNRKQYLPKLMKYVRFGQLNTKNMTTFLNQIRLHPYVKDNRECHEVLMDNFELIPLNEGGFLGHKIAKPRIPHEILFVIGGWSINHPVDFIEAYDCRADRWTKIHAENSLGRRAYHGTAVVGQDIYVIGGFNGIEYFNSCRKFVTREKMWKEIAPMNSSRCYVTVVQCNDTIYALGGHNGEFRVRSAEKYDCKCNQWTLISPMHIERSDASAACLNNKIYITGGFSGHSYLNSCEMYNPLYDQWCWIEPMRHRRSGMSCIAYHDFIYAIGGFNGFSRLSSVEKYDPKSNTWLPEETVSNISLQRSNFASAIVDDIIFIIGGYTGRSTSQQVEYYNEDTNTWNKATDMHMSRSALSACVVKGLNNKQEYLCNGDKYVKPRI